MRCAYCGAPVEKGRVFCLNCGEEIQWVPEYHAIGSYRSNEQANHRRTSGETSRWQTPPAQKEPKKKPVKPKRKWPVVLLLLLLAAAAAGGVLAYQEYIKQQQYESFDFQYQMAEDMWQDQSYEEALAYIERALVLDKEHTDAMLLKAQILYDARQTKAAVEFLQSVILTHPDSEKAYALLIQIYEEEGDTNSLRQLVDQITDPNVKEAFFSYLPVEVQFSSAAGRYQELITVELYTEGTQKSIIYYTTDGTIPTEDSEPYKVGIPLTEGTTTVKAIAVNERDIPGDMKSITYEIELPLPDIPVISPASGEYQSLSLPQIEVSVPEGGTVYYSFDEEPTTQSTRYTGPVSMPQGEHTFYAIVVDQNGKESYPGSATYVVK